MAGDPLSTDDVSMFRGLEEELWREETRFDPARMNEVIASDFFEFGGSGRIHNRDATLSLEPWPINAELPLPDFKARVLAEGVVQVTYNSVVERDGEVERRRRSSIWTQSSAGWAIRFHQGTPFAP